MNVYCIGNYFVHSILESMKSNQYTMMDRSYTSEKSTLTEKDVIVYAVIRSFCKRVGDSKNEFVSIVSYDSICKYVGTSSKVGIIQSIDALHSNDSVDLRVLKGEGSSPNRYYFKYPSDYDKVMTSLIRNIDLSWKCRAFLIAIHKYLLSDDSHNYSRFTTYSPSTISKITNMGRRFVNSRIEELEQLGYLKISREGGISKRENRKYTYNAYALCMINVLSDSNDKLQQRVEEQDKEIKILRKKDIDNTQRISDLEQKMRLIQSKTVTSN